MNDRTVAVVAALMFLYGMFILALGLSSGGALAVIAGALLCAGCAWVGASAWKTRNYDK